MEKLNAEKFRALSNEEMHTIAGGRWKLLYTTCCPSEDGGITTVAVWTRRSDTKETYD